jgi:hypothetical protein
MTEWDLAYMRRKVEPQGLTDADIDRIADAVPIDPLGVHITTWHRRFARAVLAAQPAPVPACPVCQSAPTWSHDARVGEWEGRCLHCGIDGPAGQTLDDAKAKWANWYSKPPAQPAPVPKRRET